MLKEFWEQKKHLIQLVGILTGTGALFLAIPLPDDTGAKAALLNIQFIWLLIISFGAVTILVQLWMLVSAFEKEMSEKNFKIDETLSLVMSAAIVYFIWNLWLYTSRLYAESFFSFFGGVAGVGIGALWASLSYKSWSWLMRKVDGKSFPVRAVTSLGTWLTSSVVFGAWQTFIHRKGDFSFDHWVDMSIVIYILIIVILLLVDFYKSRKVKSAAEPAIIVAIPNSEILK